MSLSAVLFLFLAHLGVGIVFTLVFVSRDAGVKFFRFNSGLAAILLVISCVLYFFQWPRAIEGGLSARLDEAYFIDVQLFSPIAFLACTVLTILSWATVGRLFTKLRTAILTAAAVAGVIALVAQAIEISLFRSPAVVALTAASFLTSAALLGGACTAMIL